MPGKLKEDNILNEADSRKQLISLAQKFGCEQDLLKIFARVDGLMRGAKTAEEKQMISLWGIQEINKFFTGGVETALDVRPGKQLQAQLEKEKK